MKNITTVEKNGYTKGNSKNNNNCLAVFFGIIHFDDMLNSPGIRTNKKAGLVCGGESLFFGS